MKVPGFEVFIIAGFQLPVTPGLLVDVPGNIPGVSPLQYVPNGSKVGTVGSSMTICRVAVFAHNPVVGVKV